MSSPYNEQSSWEKAVRVVKPDQFESHTSQTAGMRRLSTVSRPVAETRGIWAGATDVQAHAGTGKHHHGEQETVIYVVRGSIRMVWGEHLPVVCGLGKSRPVSSVYPEQYEIALSSSDRVQTRQNPESTNYRYSGVHKE